MLKSSSAERVIIQQVLDSCIHWTACFIRFASCVESFLTQRPVFRKKQRLIFLFSGISAQLPAVRGGQKPRQHSSNFGRNEPLRKNRYERAKPLFIRVDSSHSRTTPLFLAARYTSRICDEKNILLHIHWPHLTQSAKGEIDNTVKRAGHCVDFNWQSIICSTITVHKINRDNAPNARTARGNKCRRGRDRVAVVWSVAKAYFNLCPWKIKNKEK